MKKTEETEPRDIITVNIMHLELSSYVILGKLLTSYVILGKLLKNLKISFLFL